MRETNDQFMPQGMGIGVATGMSILVWTPRGPQEIGLMVGGRIRFNADHAYWSKDSSYPILEMMIGMDGKLLIEVRDEEFHLFRTLHLFELAGWVREGMVEVEAAPESAED